MLSLACGFRTSLFIEPTEFLCHFWWRNHWRTWGVCVSWCFQRLVRSLFNLLAFFEVSWTCFYDGTYGKDDVGLVLENPFLVIQLFYGGSSLDLHLISWTNKQLLYEEIILLNNRKRRNISSKVIFHVLTCMLSAYRKTMSCSLQAKLIPVGILI